LELGTKDSINFYQLSHSVGEVLSEDAVRDSFAGAKEQEHVAKKLTVPKETHCES
jgi:hypothetical protein